MRDLPACSYHCGHLCWALVFDMASPHTHGHQQKNLGKLEFLGWPSFHVLGEMDKLEEFKKTFSVKKLAKDTEVGG